MKIKKKQMRFLDRTLRNMKSSFKEIKSFAGVNIESQFVKQTSISTSVKMSSRYLKSQHELLSKLNLIARKKQTALLVDKKKKVS